MRDARPEDASGVADVHIRTWQEAYQHVFPAEGLAGLDEGRLQRERFWLDAIEAAVPRRHILVVETPDGAVGFASVGATRDDDTLGELYAIYVLSEHWGRGVGAALMREALERLRRDDFDEAVLWVLADNPRARAFYERWAWFADGVARGGVHLETPTHEVRYRIALRT